MKEAFKKRWFSLSLWLFLLILPIWPVYYFFIHCGDKSFLDNAMGNLFASIVAVVIGIPIALEINRRQQRAEEAIQRKKERQRINERLQHLIGHVSIELINNRDHLERLKKALNRVESSRTDVWKLANAIADAFSFAVFAEFRKSPDVDELFPESHDILVSYLSMERLVHDVRVASCAHDLAFSYGGGEKKANIERKDTLAEIDVVAELLKQAEVAYQKLLLKLNEQVKKHT